jgi:hypothetical protein
MAATLPPLWSKRVYLFLFSGLFLVAGGCGLRDYEKHMDEERAYLNEFDEENKSLGEPVEIPQKEVFIEIPNTKKKTPMQTDAFPVKIFLRPPRWIAPQARKDTFTFERVSLYCYPGSSGFNLLFTDAEPDKNPSTGYPFKNGIAPKDFRDQVRGALVQFVQREHKLAVTGWQADDNLKKESFLVKDSQGRPKKLDFEKQVFPETPAGAKEEPKQSFEVYYLQEPTYQAAIIFEIPTQWTRDQTTRRIVEYSLKSLAFAQEAVAMAQAQAMAARRRAAAQPPPKIVNPNDIK